MKTRTRFVRVAALVALGLTACSSGDNPHAEDAGAIEDSAVPLSERMQKLNSVLNEQSRGGAVRTLHEYLTIFGYFPNAELAALFPAWRPIVANAPQDVSTYDETTAEAVRGLQRSTGLVETGIVDAATLAVLKSPRCGVPAGLEAADPSEKYALGGSRWSKSSLTWKVLNTDDVTITQARAAASAAFASWAAQTSLTFTQITTSATADIQMTFAFIDGAGGRGAQAAYPQEGGDVTIDTSETWSVASTTPAGQIDLQTVLLHEIGHSLGLDHSSITGATLLPTYAGLDRALANDDKVAVSTLYDTWNLLPGCALDIGVNSSGSAAWTTGCNGNADGRLSKWDGSSWILDAADLFAARVDVTPGGVPWVVDSGGAIFRRSSSSVSSGSWTRLPGCARDIGIGGDGTVWIIGCNANGGDGNLFRWNGSSWSVDPTGALGWRVTVDDTGTPWITNQAGQIWRRSFRDVSSGSWTQLPGLGWDIGISIGNYAWLIGRSGAPGGFAIHTWNEQGPLGSAPQTTGWLTISGGAVQIDVGGQGLPWIVNNAGNIFKATR